MANRAHCPIEGITRVLGRRWTLELIYYLRQRRRFCELQTLLGSLNPATLTQRLKTLEDSGLVRRFVISESPPHIEYELTEKGRDLNPALDALLVWVQRWRQSERRLEAGALSAKTLTREKG